MRPPELSVITTSLNLGLYIEDCILSVDKQRQWLDAKVNHLIMDGGSTDETSDILKRHIDKVQSYVIPGEGQTPALNHAMRIIEEEYPDTTHIGWLNADDYYQDYWLDMMLGQLNKEPDDVALICSVAKLAGIIGQATTLRGLQNYFDLRYLGTHGNTVCQPTVLIKMPAFKQMKEISGFYFNPEHKYIQDLELWCRFLINGYRIRHINKITANLRMHEFQMSRTHRDEQLIDLYRLMRTICSREGIPTSQWVSKEG